MSAGLSTPATRFVLQFMQRVRCLSIQGMKIDAGAVLWRFRRVADQTPQQIAPVKNVGASESGEAELLVFQRGNGVLGPRTPNIVELLQRLRFGDVDLLIYQIGLKF